MTEAAADLFPLAVAIVLEEEGVFSDDAQDPGGPTYYGIARAAHPDLTPWPPTKDQAIAIYRTQYWDANRCGEMPWPWALAVFDGAVNQGAPAVGLAQQALAVADDQVVGDVTLAAMNSAAPALFDLYLGLRGVRYAALATFETFGKGWLRRLARIARGAAQPAD